jgi:hypothetical protein
MPHFPQGFALNLSRSNICPYAGDASKKRACICREQTRDILAVWLLYAQLSCPIGFTVHAGAYERLSAFLETQPSTSPAFRTIPPLFLMSSAVTVWFLLTA